MSSEPLAQLVSNPLLSDTARELLSLNQAQGYTALVVHGPGNSAARKLLATLQPADLVTQPIRHPDAGKAILSGLWLWHDWLDESHTLSQEIHSGTGSFWHAIMHRREGDFSNSIYWYSRCSNHPVLGRLTDAAIQLPSEYRSNPSVFDAVGARWNAKLVVSLIEEVETGRHEAARSAAIALQQMEWEALFEFTVHEALGVR